MRARSVLAAILSGASGASLHPEQPRQEQRQPQSERRQREAAEHERERVDRLERAGAQERQRWQIEAQQRQRAAQMQHRTRLIDELGDLINPSQPESAERYVPAFGLDFGPPDTTGSGLVQAAAVVVVLMC